MSKLQYIPGQEVVVPGYGVGRVMLAKPHFGICVKTYADGVERDYAPENVKPWPEVQTWYCGCGHTNGVNLARCAACTRDPSGRLPNE